MSGLVAGRGVVIVMGRLTFVHAHSGRQPPPRTTQTFCLCSGFHDHRFVIGYKVTVWGV